MALFQCENCGCVDNTACTDRGFTLIDADKYDWTGIEDLKGMMLCSACGPSKFHDGSPARGGGWHGRFSRTFLPKGMFETNSVGNLCHKETKSEDYWPYEIKGNPDELE